MTDLNKLKKELNSLGNKKDAAILQRFFKTGPGEYGEGDIFLGIRVPAQRQVAKKYSDLSLKDIERLLRNEIHEFRLVGALILVDKYQKTEGINEKEKIVNFYLKNSSAINNWDLVDLSVDKILGEFLLIQPKKKNILNRLVKSKNLWERRMAMISTFAFIKSGSAKETIAIAKKLLTNDHDLIHKAVGWMLREAGKRINQKILTDFLDEHGQAISRTTLRYAIERLSPAKRKYYLNK